MFTKTDDLCADFIAIWLPLLPRTTTRCHQEVSEERAQSLFTTLTSWTAATFRFPGNEELSEYIANWLISDDIDGATDLDAPVNVPRTVNEPGPSDSSVRVLAQSSHPAV